MYSYKRCRDVPGKLDGIYFLGYVINIVAWNKFRLQE